MLFFDIYFGTFIMPLSSYVIDAILYIDIIIVYRKTLEYRVLKKDLCNIKPREWKL